MQRKLSWGGRYFRESISPEECARKNARDFAKVNDTTMAHWVGCTDFSTSRAVIYAIEAVRALNEGSSSAPDALKLLELAAAEVKDCVDRRYLLDAIPVGPTQ
jgi:hypothetical protein